MADRGNENARPGDETGRAQVLPEMKSTRSFEDDLALRMLECKPLIDAGFTLVQLEGVSKKPLRKDWMTRRYDPTLEVAAAVRAGNNLGVRIGPVDLVVDVDPRNGGDESLSRLVVDAGFDPADYPCVETGGGGLHIFMRRPEGFDAVAKLDAYPGIDFKTSGQVVAVGSIHPDTRKPYVGRDLHALALEASLPTKLQVLLTREQRKSGDADRSGELTPAMLAANLAMLDPDDFGQGRHDDWLTLMQSCHHATNGEGVQEFVEWSTQASGYEGDGELIAYRWNSLSMADGGVTVAYLFKQLHDRRKVPLDRQEAEDDFEVWEQPVEKNGRWKFLTIEEIQAMPPARWLVQGILLEDSIAAIFGAPESFKSFLAVDWAMSIAADRPWHGRSVLPGGVLYIAAEGARGLAKRVRAWKAEHRHSDDVPFRLMHNELNLTREKDAKAFAASVVNELGPLSLIVIDTLNQTAAGADENSAMDMGRYVASMKLLRDMTGATIVVVHHSGKDRDKGLRGSSALLGGFDTTVEVVRPDPNGMGIIVRVQKQKDEERDPQMRFNLEKVEESLVLRPTMMAEAASDFGAECDPIRELARQMTSEHGGRMALKLLVDAVIKQDGKSEKTARRNIDKAILLGRENALPSSDGTPVWRERIDNNPNGEMQVCSLVPSDFGCHGDNHAPQGFRAFDQVW